MSEFTKRQHRSLSQQGNTFKLSPVAAGCAVLLFGMMSVASAQEATPAATDTPAATTNTVVVTGIRKGIEDAISVKKNSGNIVEAISAEDIGKLPDQSIAESLARLPGISAQRVAGRAQAISIRGLSPDFANTTLNGRSQASTGDNRAAEFDQYPAELFGGVVIYKTPDAALVDQGLSGTIDMQTFDPLAFGARTVSMNVRAEKNSLGSIANSKDTGDRFSINYIDQFANRTVGVQIGIAHLQSPRNDHETGLYEPWNVGQIGGFPGVNTMNGIKSLAVSGTTKRDAMTGTLEFKPNKDFTSKIDLFYSKFSEVTTNNQWEENLGWGGPGNPSPVASNANISNGVMNGATFSGVYPLVRGEYNDREDSIKSLGWGNTMKFQGWKLLGDLNYSKAVRNEDYHEMNTQLLTPILPNGTGGNPILDTSVVNWATGGFPTMNGMQSYSNPNTLYLNNSIYGSGWGHAPHTDDTMKGIKLVATIDAPKSNGWVSDVDVGLDYSDHAKNHSNLSGPQTLINPKGSTVDPSLLYAPTDLGFSGTGMVPSFNVPGIMAKYYMPFAPNPADPANVGQNWGVTEKITTSFVKANLDHQISADVTMRGNFGLQLQNTRQTSTGEVGFDGTVTPNTVGKSYTDALPQMNLIFELPNDEVLRVSAGKQVMRPRLEDLNSGFNFNVATSLPHLPSASGGNPMLDPWRANAFDLSFEKYFAKKAYVSAAVYYKKLTSYIYSESNLYDFSQWTPGTNASTNSGFYSSQYNGQGGSISGLELAGSLPLDMLIPALNGFGIQASTGLNNSAITVKSSSFDVGNPIPLPGMSKNVASLTAYYEKSGFSARIGARYRSEFVGDIENFAGNRNLRFIAPETTVDAQVEYTFQEGTYKDLGLFLQMGNLTDAAYKTYQGTPNQPLEYAKYGRTLLAGLNYKF